MEQKIKSLLIKGTRRAAREFAYFRHRPARVLFDHLPKCAGRTMVHYLERNYPRRMTFRTDGHDPKKSVRQFQSLPQAVRYRFRLIAGHLAHDLLDYVHPDTIMLTVFREPVDRLVSHYYYVKQNPQHYLHGYVMKSGITLDDYAASGLGDELRNWYTIYFTGLALEEAENSPEESVQCAFREISERYDIVGFQEDLPEATVRLKVMAHLPTTFRNDVQNRTGGRPRLEDVDERTKKTIAAINFLDVKLYARLRQAFSTVRLVSGDGSGIAAPR